MKLTFRSNPPGSDDLRFADSAQRMSAGERVDESGLLLVNASLASLDARRARLAHLHVAYADLHACDFSAALLAGFNMEGGAATDTSFALAHLAKGSFAHCTLRAVSFRQSNLDRVEFTGVRFDGVDFDGASLVGASFDECDLHGLRLNAARLDDTHCFDCLIDDSMLALPGLVIKSQAAGNAATPPVRFLDMLVCRDERFSLGIEQASGACYLSIPVSNAYVDYEEYYAITPEQLRCFKAAPAQALPFVDACRRRMHDELLLIRPGRLRGVGT